MPIIPPSLPWRGLTIGSLVDLPSIQSEQAKEAPKAPPAPSEWGLIVGRHGIIEQISSPLTMAEAERERQKFIEQHEGHDFDYALITTHDSILDMMELVAQRSWPKL